MKFLLMILLITGLVSCSGSKLANDAQDSLDEAGTEFSEAGDEFEEEGEDLVDDAGLGDDDELEEGEEGDIADDEGLDDELDESEGDIAQEDISPAPSASMEMTGSNGDYNVQSGDTLMIIAFKIYGDYDRWRSLASLNSGKLGPNHSISVGMTLKYNEPSEKFEWNPSGNPYLIRVGDTLGTISRDTYGSMGYWKNIWTNNKPLIKDPNRIFAGFTIYTPTIEGRGVANQEL